jgi:hypothetical protein
MVTDAIKELNAAKAKVAALEQSLAKELKQNLASLPSEYGFDNLADFIQALKNASGARRGRKPGKSVVSKPAKSGKRAKRARLTPELKASVKAAVNAGKTGTAIAQEFGISLPSVQNIKKEFGLVKKRG